MKSSLRQLSDKTLPLTVKNTGFLLERLGQDCHPLQFLRELTQNSIEAILRTESKTGEVRWDVDWTSYELDDYGAFKLCVADNGDGMTGENMVTFINQLSSSLTIQSLDGNFGVRGEDRFVGEERAADQRRGDDGTEHRRLHVDKRTGERGALAPRC